MNVCRNIAEEVAKGRLSKEDIDDLMAQLEMEKELLAGIDGIDAKLLERGRVIASDAMIEAMNAKRELLRNILIENGFVKAMTEANALTGNPSLGIKASLGGVNASIKGAQQSADAMGVGIIAEWTGGLVHDLKQAEVWDLFRKMRRNSDMEKDVARELANLTSRTPQKLDTKPTAKAIAKVMHKYNETMKARLNNAGAFIRDKDGWIGSTRHDPRAMRLAGKAAWIAEARKRFDFERMRIPVSKIDDYLESAYVAAESGIRLTDEIAPIAGAFKGPGNLAKKLSVHRAIEFKTPDDWLAYNNQFGSGSLTSNFMANIDRSARAVGLMDRFGTNPGAMLERVREIGRRTYRDDAAKLAGFDTKGETFEALLAELDGSVNFGSGTRVAEIGANIRAIQTLAKLGSAILSVPSDLAHVMATSRYQGRTALESLGDALLSPIKGFGGAATRIVAESMGIGIDGMLGAIHARMNPAETMSRARAQIMDKFFKLNFLTQWTEAVKRGQTAIMANHLARLSVHSFGDLPPEGRRLLEIYGIDAREWEVARQAVKEVSDGNKYLMPGEVDAVRGAMFDGLSEPQQQRLRDGVREKIFAMFTHESDFAVPVPGARERAILRRGFKPGTPEGEALRFMAQFKGFPVTVITKSLGRQIYGTGAPSIMAQLGKGVSANADLASFIAASTVLGYVSYQAKQIAAGKEPRQMSANLVLASMMQGGALGIYGDFLFAEANRNFGGPLETLAGPSLGTIADFVQLMNSARAIATGKNVNFAGDAIRLVKSNLPFANLFYAKGAMDYMIWYQLQEMLNPGYLGRMERRVKKQLNQDFIVRPSSVVQRGGGFK